MLGLTTLTVSGDSEVELRISAATNRFALLQPITVNAVLSNATSRPLQLSRVGIILDYGVIVKRAGEPVPQTEFARWQERQSQKLGGFVYHLAPGQSETYTIPVNQLFDMTLPDTYTVAFSKRVTVREGTKSEIRVVKSNEIQILVQWSDRLSSELREAVFQARKTLLIISLAVDAFKADCGVYPSPETGVQSLVKNPGIDNWNGPYLKLDPQGILKDPWGSSYRYRLIADGYRVDSAGPDRTFDTEDDVTRDPPRDRSM